MLLKQMEDESSRNFLLLIIIYLLIDLLID